MIDDNQLGITGEKLPGVYGSMEFIGWLNGHPEYRNKIFNFDTSSAVVVGHGNVALDTVRLLAKTTGELQNTDIPDPVLKDLSKNNIRTIYLIGRRGPAQVAFSYKELKEISDLESCNIEIDPSDLILNTASKKELENEKNSAKRRIVELLEKFTTHAASSKAKTIKILFNKSPIEIIGENRVEKIILRKNFLSGPAGNQQVVPTNEQMKSAVEPFLEALVFMEILFRVYHLMKTGDFRTY